MLLRARGGNTALRRVVRLVALAVAGVVFGLGCDATAEPLAGGGPSGLRPPGPDLVLHAVTVRQARLVVLVANDGATEFTTPIMVTVSDGPPRRIDLGSPLRPGEALEVVLNTEYVQRRAHVTVEVSTAAEDAGANRKNNQLATVVGPDQPLDLVLDSARLDPADARLVVTVSSRAPIPLVGTVSVSVREPAPSLLLLAQSDERLEVSAGGSQEFRLRTLTQPDPAKVTVAISTDAIADADPANDVLPR